VEDLRRESELVALSRQGDKDAFTGLVQMHAQRVFNLCYRFCGNYDQANDLAQDVFVQAFKNIGKFNQKASFATWTHRIAMNLWLNKVKRNKIASFVPLEKQKDDEDEKKSMIEILPDGLTPEQIAQKNDLNAKVQQALGLLNEDYRTAIVLKYVEDKSLEEIAVICNCTVGTIGSRLSRVLKELQKYLEGY